MAPMDECSTPLSPCLAQHPPRLRQHLEPRIFHRFQRPREYPARRVRNLSMNHTLGASWSPGVERSPPYAAPSPGDLATPKLSYAVPVPVGWAPGRQFPT